MALHSLEGERSLCANDAKRNANVFILKNMKLKIVNVWTNTEK